MSSLWTLPWVPGRLCQSRECSHRQQHCCGSSSLASVCMQEHHRGCEFLEHQQESLSKRAAASSESLLPCLSDPVAFCMHEGAPWQPLSHHTCSVLYSFACTHQHQVHAGAIARPTPWTLIFLLHHVWVGWCVLHHAGTLVSCCSVQHIQQMFTHTCPQSSSSQAAMRRWTAQLPNSTW
jgi:hypothetical protein